MTIKCLKTTVDNFVKFREAIDGLRAGRVLVGVPEENAGREEGSKINNAQIAYIHNFGAPEAGIPSREFMNTGIDAVKGQITAYFKQAAQAAFDGNIQAVKKAYGNAGMVAKTSITKKIADGIPPPLADSTLKARARRKQGKGLRINKGAQAELVSRGFGNEASTEYAKPLIDSGSFYRSINYIVKGV